MEIDDWRVERLPCENLASGFDNDQSLLRGLCNIARVTSLLDKILREKESRHDAGAETFGY